MALIACPECAKGISDKAPACPHCGFPAPGQHAPAPQQRATTEAAPVVPGPELPKRKAKTAPTTWLALLLVIIGGLIYFNSSGYQKQFKPDMPVAVKYRKAITGPGLVLMVENHSERQLAILATLKNPSLNNTRNFRFDIAPGGTTSAGYREGWTLSSGDQITLSHDDYKDWQGTIP